MSGPLSALYTQKCCFTGAAVSPGSHPLPICKITNQSPAPQITESEWSNFSAPRGLAYLHSERGVHAMVEVKVGGAVVGPARDPQVAVPDATIQLALYGVLLQCMDPAQVKALESDPPPPKKK